MIYLRIKLLQNVEYSILKIILNLVLLENNLNLISYTFEQFQVTSFYQFITKDDTLEI